MASIVNKALAYLGLKDIEDDELYEDGYDDADVPTGRGGHTVYPPDRDHEEPPEPRNTFTGTVRPITNDDTSSSRGAIVRPLVPNRQISPRVEVVAPARFSDATEIADFLKAQSPVIVNLQLSDRDLSRRMIDFCSGLTYALDGRMNKVADQVFLLAPSNVEVSAEERQRLQERGLFEQR